MPYSIRTNRDVRRIRSAVKTVEAGRLRIQSKPINYPLGVGSGGGTGAVTFQQVITVCEGGALNTYWRNVTYNPGTGNSYGAWTNITTEDLPGGSP